MGIEKIIFALNELRIKYKADSVKVYLLSESNYRVKFIKDGKVIHVLKLGSKNENARMVR